MTVVTILAAIIQLVLLVVFFVMAYNVSKIKKHLLTGASGDKYFNMAQEEMHIGHKEKAKEYLLRAKYYYEIKHEGATEVYVNDDNWTLTPHKRVAEINEQLSNL